MKTTSKQDYKMIANIDFSKTNDGLIPAIIQDAITGNVLMLGYMNQEALEKTILEKQVTFFSRSKKRLWTKGETSGNYIELVDIKTDCDNDTILIKAKPTGPVCHKGNATCFEEENKFPLQFLLLLEEIIKNRKANYSEKSYTSTLFVKGINKIAQKFGEESVELLIEAKDQNNDLFLNEAADLLFHYMILLQAKDFSFNDVVKILESRQK